jgi:uncharacterized membrane protein
MQSLHLFCHIIFAVLLGGVGIVVFVVEFVLEGQVFDDEFMHVLAEIFVF